jgi:hypothetical protein
MSNRNILSIVLHLPSGEPVVYGSHGAPDVTKEGRDSFSAKGCQGDACKGVSKSPILTVLLHTKSI